MNKRDCQNTSTPTHEHLAKLLGDRDRLVVCNNTTLTRYDPQGSITVRLHGHPIIVAEPNGEVTLSSCGYRTVTTKDRLNRFLPYGVRVWQENFRWYLHIYGQDVQEFEDGITVRNS